MIPTRPVLITGAAGALGGAVAAHLAALGWPLRLTDLAPLPGEVPAGCTFARADLEDGVTMLRLAEGCGTVLHFGSLAWEGTFEQVLGPNIRGAFHVYEAARRARARVVFASSNHPIGFHGVDEALDADCALMPDTFYGLAKAYTELLGSMYWHKHGVENVNIRIGSCYPEPQNARHLATWLSYPDLCRLCERATLAEATGHIVVWGASDNARSYWRGDDRAVIGWTPQDSADGWAGRVGHVVDTDPVALAYQGGFFAAMGYTRPA